MQSGMFSATRKILQKGRTRNFTFSQLPITQLPVEVEKLQNGSLWVRNILFIPESGLIATAGMDSTIRIFDIDLIIEGKPVRYLNAHTSMVRSLILLDTNIVASAGADGNVMLWCPTNGDLLDRTHIAATEATAMVKLDNNRFIVGSGIGELFVYWHDKGGSLQEIRRIYQAHNSMVSDIAANDNLVLSVSDDRSAVLRDAHKYTKVVKWRHKHPITAAAISERNIVTASFDTLRIRTVDRLHITKIWVGIHPGSWIYSLKFISNSFLMTTGANGIINVIDLTEEKPSATLKTDLDAVWDAEVLLDGRIAVCGSWNLCSFIIKPVMDFRELKSSRSFANSFLQLARSWTF